MPVRPPESGIAGDVNGAAPSSGITTTNWPDGSEITPSEIVAGAVELTVVEPILKVVLLVDEYRQSVTDSLATGQ
jgi:hypothetical protein